MFQKLKIGSKLFSSPMKEILQNEESVSNDIFMIRDANDPVILKYQGQSPSSNFAVIKAASFSEDNLNKVDFNGVSKFQKGVDYNYLKSLQFEESGKYGTVQAKMNWLGQTKGEGRPYWFKGTTYTFGSIFFARTLIKVEMDGNSPKPYIHKGTYPSGITENILFYRVIGMPKDLMKSGLSGKEMHEKYPYWIVKATSFGDGGSMNETPRGATHYHCVWNTENYPTNFGTGKLYIAEKFLV